MADKMDKKKDEMKEKKDQMKEEYHDGKCDARCEDKYDVRSN